MRAKNERKKQGIDVTSMWIDVASMWLDVASMWIDEVLNYAMPR